jgi:RNA polymerase sigma-70 factor (ECF subfamily)
MAVLAWWLVKAREARQLGPADGMTGPRAERMTPLDFAAVYRDQFGYVFRTMRRLGVRPADLDDLVQEAFTVVLKRLNDYETDRPIEPWLFGIAFRVAAAHRRHRSRRITEVPSPQLEHADLDGAGPEASFADRQARLLVLQALEALDLDQRAVFVMHDIDEQPAPAIADVLEIPINTVYSRLRAARAKFEARIRKLRASGRLGGEP